MVQNQIKIVYFKKTKKYKTFKYYLVLLSIMETISLKIDENMEKKISTIMKEFNFSTKTEFIREAIRKNISQYELEKQKKEQWKKLLSMKGTFKGKTKNLSDEEFRKVREEIGNKILAEYESSK